MNNKGFTLIEALAVIVIIAVLGGVVSYNVISAINTSRNRAEDAFLDELGDQIEMYISLNSPKLKGGTTFNFNKEITSKNDSKVNSYFSGRNVNVWEIYDNNKGVGNRLTIGDLINEGYSDEDEFVNPNNNNVCSLDSKIIMFMDSDSVYYYYLEDSNCFSKNKVVSTLSKELICVLDDNYNNIKNNYKKNHDNKDACSMN